ncbi:MAG: DUF3887 domain-containing protein [Chloroherpetonaceae bacterium]|nr:DUF3887 domain-containing protein [Chloroherpetonaceae bacterium]
MNNKFSMKHFAIFALLLTVSFSAVNANVRLSLAEKSQAFIESLFNNNLRKANSMLSTKSVFRDGTNLEEYRDAIAATFGDFQEVRDVEAKETEQGIVYTAKCVFNGGNAKAEIHFDRNGLIERFTFKSAN